MSREIRTDVKKANEEAIEIERYSKDFRVRVSINFSWKPEPSSSGSRLVDNILKGFGNFSVRITTEDVINPEVIENMGFAFGEALSRMHEKRKAKPSSSCIHSESGMMCMFAFDTKQDGDASMQVTGRPEFDSEHFFSFFDGFAQGFDSELSAVINFGKKKSSQNHQLRLVSRTFGKSIEQMFSV